MASKSPEALARRALRAKLTKDHRRAIIRHMLSLGYVAEDIAKHQLGIALSTYDGVCRRGIPRGEDRKYIPTPRRMWKLSIPYFDGQCEAMCSAKGHMHKQDRCVLPARHPRDGYAVCHNHVRVKLILAFAKAARDFRKIEAPTLVESSEKREKRPWEKVDWDSDDWT